MINTTNNSISQEEKERLIALFKDYKKKPLQVTNLDTQVIVYPCINEFETKSRVGVSTIIENIKTSSERLSVKHKNELPVAYFSVTDFNGRKIKDHVLSHTGLIIIDIDAKDNPHLDFNYLKQELIRDNYVHATFRSPSGGIKVLVKTDLNNIENHNAYFEYIKDYFLKKYSQIKKIDISGSNINRACYLPYDKSAFFNQFSVPFHPSIKEIDKITVKIKVQKKSRSSSNAIDIDSITLDEHIDNLIDIIKNRTSIPPIIDNTNTQNRTLIPLNDSIFNNYRFNNITDSIMSTNVLFLELLILKNAYPYRLDYSTNIDEVYFKDDINKILHINDIGCPEGLDFCEFIFPKNSVIKLGFRTKTLYRATIILIFNNPLCHPKYIYNEVRRLNDTYCEDPHPYTNPKPDGKVVYQIVQTVYEDFIDGTLDFTGVIRKNRRTKQPMFKFTFKSRNCQITDKKEMLNQANLAFSRGEKDKRDKLYHQAILTLQDGRKITQKRIAEHMGIDVRTIRRHYTSKIKALVLRYNKSLKK